MFRPKSNSNVRKAPTELDNEAPIAPVLEFDYTCCTEPSKSSWPTHHFGQKFGPSLIRKAWAAGLVVYAEVDDVPHPIAVKEANWNAGGLWVRTLERPRSPTRLFTRDSVAGMTASGLLMERKQT